MKLISKYIALLTSIFVLATGCKKTFLETDPYSSISLDIAITTEADLKAAVNGLYAGLRSYSGLGRYIPAKGDLMSDNAYTSVSNTGRQNSTYNLYSFTTSNGEASSIYSNMYIVIKRANQIISSTVPSSTTVNEYKGEAYAARALAHLELVRNFAYPYASGADQPGVPIITDFFSSDIKPARATIGEVYQQIISDLNQAYSLMTIYASSAYFSKYAAKALQARAYLDMGDWANAKAAALDVVSNGGFTLVESTGLVSFWGDAGVSSNKQEVIFELSCDATTNNGNESLSYLYFQGGSYGDYLVTSELYNLYSSTDVRKKLIVPAVRGGYNVYASVKYPNSLNSADKDDVPVLRYAETLLILAETYYHTSDPTNALLYLNTLAKKRDPSFAGYTSTGSQLLEDILTEKRKELAFEGERFWDLYRLQRSFTKVVEQSLGTTMSVTIPSTKGVRFPIPQSEIEANANMVQNTEYY